jgi:hypothetical protein
MRTEQKKRLIEIARQDVVYLAAASLMLIDHWIGTTVAIMFTVYIAVIWATLMLKWDSIVIEMNRQYRHSGSPQMFVLNCAVAVVMSCIILFSPIDAVWSGIIFGLYMTVSLLSAKIYQDMMKNNL